MPVPDLKDFAMVLAVLALIGLAWWYDSGHMATYLRGWRRRRRARKLRRTRG
ncbi:hypothetical protein AB0M95_01950 [Sphaerisporangium sp. NPDC051017]|uniref:hypothetical protein n=1 Tax=Sphaerisporangium sp. NPDC051017 TaxID=3154636 RepID=UPI0034491EE7